MTLVRKLLNPRLAIVLLAAGEGSRMGSIPKALLRQDGKTFLGNFCTTVKALDPVEFVVITGFHASAIEEELKSMAKSMDLSISIVRNEHAPSGQSSSVRLGLESLGDAYDAVLMCLSDQPFIGEAELNFLLSQFNERAPNQDIVMPIVHGQRGNPVVISRKAVKEMLAIPGMVCRSFMDNNPNRIKIVHSDNEAYILDVDTDADIQKLGITRN